MDVSASGLVIKLNVVFIWMPSNVMDRFYI